MIPGSCEADRGELFYYFSVEFLPQELPELVEAPTKASLRGERLGLGKLICNLP